MKPIRVAIVGLGTISRIYLHNLTTIFRPRVDVVGCADLDPARARAAASEWNLPRAYDSVEELLADPVVDVVVNLTVPAAHYEICMRALDAGKHCYTEKPLATDLADAREIVARAAAGKLRIAAAPDTVLGHGTQTARAAIEQGLIGQPVGGNARFLCPGHEAWHPAPEFYYQRGGGPLFDMGPYYLTALVHLLGPISAVTGIGRTTHEERTIGAGPRAGTRFGVSVATHVSALLEFASGAVVTLALSFDVVAPAAVPIELFGTNGTLHCADPNTFGGTVAVIAADGVGRPLEPVSPYGEDLRGLGVAELADAIASGRPHRVSGELGLHVVSALEAIQSSAEHGRRVTIDSQLRSPQPLRDAL